jgi:hypothetical protein
MEERTVGLVTLDDSLVLLLMEKYRMCGDGEKA